MAATVYYVDPAINANSGVGSVGSPFGDLQYALNTVTRDATNGDKFLIKSGTAEVLSAALSLATYGTPTNTAQLFFEGYASTAGDGDLAAGTGIADISGNGSVACIATGFTFVNFRHVRFHNCGSAAIVTSATDCVFDECEFDETTGSGIVSTGPAHIFNCYFHNIGTRGIDATNGAFIYGNYFKNGANDFTIAIRLNGNNHHVVRNVISVDGSSIGIQFASTNVILNNSILSAAGSGTGIGAPGVNQSTVMLMNNLIEGFSATGGLGIDYPTTLARGYSSINNSIYNCATAFTTFNSRLWLDLNNETLSASPFAKSGSDTFANRFNYFAPTPVGSVYKGSFLTGSRLDRGAVQSVGIAGGGNMRGGFIN